ncbi:hypothetical protein QBC34DRAFT_459356 [Podospora aff. communis PSN243]|uniref:SRR1-like domain-containing protein n=1 Tax=Podospora aff. communis PSN243 TaxID=3040156 RepID=A0AAV9GT46_9PEZI|nr:hypothetical protein QBC34DRAFT_459356 [Podospora aff. communis PSN243]
MDLKPFWLQGLLPDPQKVTKLDDPKPPPTDVDVTPPRITNPDLSKAATPTADDEANPKDDLPKSSASSTTLVEKIVSRYLETQSTDGTLSPNPDDTTAEARPSPPAHPLYPRATLTHLEHIFWAWEYFKLTDRKVEITDFVGRTFLVPCQINEASRELDNIAPNRDSSQNKHTSCYNEQGLRPSDEVVRGRPFIRSVRKIILFGAGTLTMHLRESYQSTGSERAHAILLVLRAWLSEKQNVYLENLWKPYDGTRPWGVDMQSVNSSKSKPQLLQRSRFRCLAQDPIYQEEDETTLKEYDVFVVHDPSGLLEVDSSSIVIAAGCKGIRETIADIEIPNPLMVIQPFNKMAGKYERPESDVLYSPSKSSTPHGRPPSFNPSQQHRRHLWHQLYDITPAAGRWGYLNGAKEIGFEVLVLKNLPIGES